MPGWEKVYTISYLLGESYVKVDKVATDGTDFYLLLYGSSTSNKLYKYTVATESLDLWLEPGDGQIIYDIACSPFDSYFYVAYKDGETVKLATMTRASVLTAQLTLVDMSETVYELREEGVHFGQTDSQLRLSCCYDTTDEGSYAIATAYNLGGNIWATFNVEPANLESIYREPYLADRDIFRVIFTETESLYEFEGVSSFTQIIATNPHAPVVFQQISQRDEDRLWSDTPAYYSDDEWATLDGDSSGFAETILRSCDNDYFIDYGPETLVYIFSSGDAMVENGEVLDPPDEEGGEIIIRNDYYTYLFAIDTTVPPSPNETVSIWRRGKVGNYYESKGGLPGLNI